MSHRLVGVGAALAAVTACTPPAPSAAGTGVPAPVTVVDSPSTLPAEEVVRFGPGVQRYAVHRRLHVAQEIGAMPPTDLRYHVFVSVTITGPPDTLGLPVSYTIDSLVPDSGIVLPPVVIPGAVQGLRFTGRLAPTGEIREALPSDSATAAAFAQFIGNPRDFFPRLPDAGLTAGAAWVDTVTTTERGAVGEVTVQAVNHSTVPGWELRDGRRALRIDVRSTFTLSGTSEQSGQPLEYSGSGTRAAVEFVGAEGQYLGGEAHDTVRINVTLPAQGVTVPIRQILHSTVAVLP